MSIAPSADGMNTAALTHVGHNADLRRCLSSHRAEQAPHELTNQALIGTVMQGGAPGDANSRRALMTVGVTVGSITDELGAPSFVHSFFSTVSAHCEPDGWGSRFPHLMNELYQGRLSHGNALLALGELRQAKAMLSSLPPSSVVWEIENRQSKPPWGSNIAAEITSLGNYFVSSTGRDVFSILEEVLAASAQQERDAVLQ
jgi:hypothetical protein